MITPQIKNSSIPKSYWDSIIKPRNSLFELKLEEVWQYRDMLALFVRRDLIAKYKQTILGPLWYFIQPLFMQR